MFGIRSVVGSDLLWDPGSLYSQDHKSGHAHRGRGACTAWLFADGAAKRCNPAFPFQSPCVSMVKTWLEPLWHATDVSTPPAPRRFYLDSLADTWLSKYRSPNSPFRIPPLLRLGSVGVLISVPVALVIKRAGYTATPLCSASSAPRTCRPLHA